MAGGSVLACDSDGDAVDAPQRLPALRSDVRLLPVSDPLLPDWTLFDPARGKYFKVGWVEFEMLSRWSLGTSAAIVDEINTTTTLHVEQAQFDSLLSMLAENELLRADTTDNINQLLTKKNSANGSLAHRLFTFALFYRQPLFNPNNLLRVLEKVASPLFSYKRAVLSVCMIALLLVITGISAHAYEFKDQFTLFASPEGMFCFFAVLVFTNVAHEFGHGIVAKHFGCNVRTMGVALIFMIPVCYCDTTDAWRLKSRYQRQLINAGGILIESVIALVALGLWLVLPEGTAKSLAFFLGVTSLATTLLINLNPFLKFDGYFLIADYLQIDNLQHKSFSAMRWQTRQWVTGRAGDYPNQVPLAKHKTLCVYATCTWVYRLFLYMAIALMVYTFWFKALGMVLLVGVVMTLLVTPVAREVGYFFNNLINGGVNRQSFITLLVGGMFLLLFIVPVPRGITAPAVISAALSTTYYAPVAAQVKSISLSEGAVVREGDLLVQLHDPDLLYQRRLLTTEVDYLRDLLRQRITQTENSAQRSVGELDLTSRLESLADINLQIENLSLYASHDGRVTGLDSWLEAGVWVARNRAMLNIVSDVTEVRAYLRARDVDSIATMDGVLKLDGVTSGIATTGVSITNDNVATLEDKSLAVSYGGDIAVSADENGDLIPMQDWHQINLAANEHTNREQKGYVVFEAEPRSIAGRFAERLYGVLLRESGF